MTGKSSYNPNGKLGVPGPGQYNDTLVHLAKLPTWRYLIYKFMIIYFSIIYSSIIQSNLLESEPHHVMIYLKKQPKKTSQDPEIIICWFTTDPHHRLNLVVKKEVLPRKMECLAQGSIEYLVVW